MTQPDHTSRSIPGTKWLVLAFFFTLACSAASAQAELAPWGNLLGIRVNGQLMAFETDLRVVKGAGVEATGKERQRPKYERINDSTQRVTTAIGALSITEEVTDLGTGKARLSVSVTALEEVPADGIYLGLSLPGRYYENGSVRILGGNVRGGSPPIALKNNLERIQRHTAHPFTGLRFGSPLRRLDVGFGPEKGTLLLHAGRNGKERSLQFSIPIHTGVLSKGSVARKVLSFEAGGVIDKSPVQLTVQADAEGRPFEGFGGNFRLQNLRTDPLVIDYALQNMRVAWGRVEMPWQLWQTEKGGKPLDSARAGKLHPHVRRSMEMAQRLYKMGMPVILSAWSGPAWAVVGTPKLAPGPDGVWGNPLEKSNMQAIYQSIGDYVAWLKEGYGVEIVLFSFNESDLGINIRQTGEEHAELIKGLGQHFAARGLKTKMLLGDNSDANSYSFIYPAMEDSATHPYIGAISFHSWRGWERATLQRWADAAAKLNRPLIIGEGSIDAQAWGYPAIFQEPTYALEEINLYTRLLNITQPLSILQWQLTADYSPLAGGGIFGQGGPLRPTQRFWNLKQLASTPARVKALAAQSDKEDVTIAALGNSREGVYAVHIVNNGPARVAQLSGLPLSVTSLHLFVTDKNRGMKEEKAVPVRNGKASFTLETGSFTSLMNRK